MEAQPVYGQGEFEVEKQCDEPLVKKPVKKGKVKKKRVEPESAREEADTPQNPILFSAQLSFADVNKAAEKIGIVKAMERGPRNSGNSTPRNSSGGEQSFTKP